MNILIGITTYNRPEMFRELVEDIQRFCGDHEVMIIACNDGSDVEYPTPKDFFVPVIFHNFPENGGKKGYFRLVNYLFNQARNEDFDLFYMLPDDVRLKKDFFKMSIFLWEWMDYLCDLMCLSVGHDHDRHLKPNWTGFNPVPVEGLGIVRTQWNDLCFMCDKRFFEVLPEIEVPESRWNKNPNLGSGVGQFISVYLHNQGYTMFHTYESLVTFTGAIAGKPSMMHR